MKLAGCLRIDDEAPLQRFCRLLFFFSLRGLQAPLFPFLFYPFSWWFGARGSL